MDGVQSYVPFMNVICHIAIILALLKLAKNNRTKNSAYIYAEKWQCQ
jgi:hypothetical protein